MSQLKRSLKAAFVLAIAWTFVPAGVSPTGQLEVEELCASGNCERKAGSACIDGGQVLWGWKNIIG